MRKRNLVLVMLSLCGGACGGKDAAGASTQAPAAQAPEPAPAMLERADAVEAAPVAAPGTASDGEACGQIIVSAYKGARFAADDVTRSPAEARARAQALLAKVQAGADFAALARNESEAPSSAPRGGVMGTFERPDWPAIHAALEAPLFGLQVGTVAQTPVETPYGFVVLKRCPVEKVHGRHILVRYAGAKRAEASVTRTRAQARAQAEALLARLQAGEDFAALARAESEDSSAERGGDIGSPGRGRLALPFERALWALQPGQRSDVVETEFGFHLVERLPDP